MLVSWLIIFTDYFTIGSNNANLAAMTVDHSWHGNILLAGCARGAIVYPFFASCYAIMRTPFPINYRQHTTIPPVLSQPGWQIICASKIMMPDTASAGGDVSGHFFRFYIRQFTWRKANKLLDYASQITTGEGRG